MPPAYRLARFDDLPAIVAIYNSTVASRMVTADTEPVSVASRHAWFAEHTPEKRPLWVLESNAGILGWLSYSNFYGRPACDAADDPEALADVRDASEGYIVRPER